MLRKRDLRIISELRANSRTPITELSRKTKLPRSTIYNKLALFNQADIITKYTALYDFSKLGKNLCAEVLFKVEPNHRDNVGDMLLRSEFTNNVTKLGNEYDFLVSFVCKDMDEFNFALDKMLKKYKIAEHMVFYVASELKNEGFIP